MCYPLPVPADDSSAEPITSRALPAKEVFLPAACRGDFDFVPAFVEPASGPRDNAPSWLSTATVLHPGRIDRGDIGGCCQPLAVYRHQRTGHPPSSPRCRPGWLQAHGGSPRHSGSVMSEHRN